MTGVGRTSLAITAIASPDDLLADPSRCAQVAIAELQSIAGPGLRLVSLAIEMGPVRPLSGSALVIDPQIEKRSRSIAFLRLQVWDGEALVFGGRAVFAAAPE